MNALPPEFRAVAETALKAMVQKRLFHWELEFPEVFYGPRPGATRTIERLEGAGFDAVIGNPPYDVLATEELGHYVSQDLAFYEAMPCYEPAIRGARNLYKLFVCRCACILNNNIGTVSLIVPMSLLGDDQAAGVRKMLLERMQLIAVEAFPQKDNPSNRVFAEAKLPTTVFVVRAKHTGIHFTVRTHPGRLIGEGSPVLRVMLEDILRFDPETLVIPSCTQRDWDIATTILSTNICRLGEVARCFRGDMEQTKEIRAGTLGADKKGPLVLRGANITSYAVREASQGDELHLDVEKFLRRVGNRSKAFVNYGKGKVGYQRSAPQNNFRRIIAAPLSPNSFCLDTVSYVTEESSQIDLDLLLALLNAKILDWYFRLGSTNSKVNEYQFNALPVPTISEPGSRINWWPLLEAGLWVELATLLSGICTEPGAMPKPVAEALSEMSRRIQEIEAQRVLKSRSERSHLAPESQPIQDAIDATLFHCYGLSEDEARYINRRLEEML